MLAKFVIRYVFWNSGAIRLHAGRQRSAHCGKLPWGRREWAELETATDRDWTDAACEGEIESEVKGYAKRSGTEDAKNRSVCIRTYEYRLRWLNLQSGEPRIAVFALLPQYFEHHGHGQCIVYDRRCKCGKYREDGIVCSVCLVTISSTQCEIILSKFVVCDFGKKHILSAKAMLCCHLITSNGLN